MGGSQIGISRGYTRITVAKMGSIYGLSMINCRLPCGLTEVGLSPLSLPVHVQGKRHQQNLAKRAAREAADKPVQPQPQRRASVRKTGMDPFLFYYFKIAGFSVTACAI